MSHIEKIEGGIRITHEWLGIPQQVEALYDSETHRLNLRLDGEQIYLSSEETTAILAQMVAWHDGKESTP